MHYRCNLEKILLFESIYNQIYTLIKVSGKSGLTVSKICTYFGMKEKQVSKCVAYFEANKMIRKTPERDGKIFYYKYYIISKIDDQEESNNKQNKTKTRLFLERVEKIKNILEVNYGYLLLVDACFLIMKSENSTRKPDR